MNWRSKRRNDLGRFGSGWKSRIENALRDRVERQLFCRAYQLNPFPLKPMDIYKAMHTKEELDAMALLQYKYKPMMTTSERMTVKFDTHRFGLQYHGMQYLAVGIHLGLGREVPIVRTYDAENSPYLFASLPDQMKDALIPWAKRFVAYEVQATDISEKLGNVFRVCNTVGQMLRLWPAIEGFLPEAGREKMLGRKVRSPYPHMVVNKTYNDEGKVIKETIVEGWRPEDLRPYELLISEALVMAELSDNIRHFNQTVEYRVA